MLRYFNRMGLVVYQADDERLSGTLVLDVQWLIDAVGTVIRDFELHIKPCDAVARM